MESPRRQLSLLRMSPAVLVLATALPCAATISGDYLEARTADVFTGPCFANSEVNLVGQEAIVAWHVRQGEWKGVPLAGLSVAAAVRAAATLGDPFADPLPARSVLVVDERASAAQREALADLAHTMAGDLLSDVVEVTAAPIRFTADEAAAISPGKSPGESSGGPMESMESAPGGSHPAGHLSPEAHGVHDLPATGLSGAASLVAGSWIQLSTRGLTPQDHLCGNEEIYYPPLTEASDATPAVTLVHTYTGPDLGRVWSSPQKRSAFVGHFSR